MAKNNNGPMLAAAAAVVILVGGIAFITSLSSGQATPFVARIRCAAAGPVALDPEVRPQADGVHLSFEADDGAQVYDVHAAGWAVGTSLGGRILRGVTETELSVPPGLVEVRCVNDVAGFDAEAPKAAWWWTPVPRPTHPIPSSSRGPRSTGSSLETGS